MRTGKSTPLLKLKNIGSLFEDFHFGEFAVGFQKSARTAVRSIDAVNIKRNVDCIHLVRNSAYWHNQNSKVAALHSELLLEENIHLGLKYQIFKKTTANAHYDKMREKYQWGHEG